MAFLKEIPLRTLFIHTAGLCNLGPRSEREWERRTKRKRGIAKEVWDEGSRRRGRLGLVSVLEKCSAEGSIHFWKQKDQMTKKSLHTTYWSRHKVIRQQRDREQKTQAADQGRNNYNNSRVWGCLSFWPLFFGQILVFLTDALLEPEVWARHIFIIQQTLLSLSSKHYCR